MASSPSSNLVTPDLNVHSFDRPRDRPAPDVLSGRWSNGDEVEIQLTRRTLLIAIKANCDGCRAFLNASLDEFNRLDVVFVASLDDEEWSGYSRPVLISPDTLQHLDVRSPPFYVLIDPATLVVLSEGVVFGPSQVATEIARFLSL
jgi:hypothetical protein